VTQLNFGTNNTGHNNVQVLRAAENSQLSQAGQHSDLRGQRARHSQIVFQCAVQFVFGDLINTGQRK
jgi:hypothetical protein